MNSHSYRSNLFILKFEMNSLTKQMQGIKLSSLVLTRLLYVKDEVEYMCMYSVLTKDVYQAIFWFHELYYTGYRIESFSLLYSIYLLFYTELNPKFDAYIRKKHELWNELQDFEILESVILNLSKLNATMNVFLMYNYVTITQSKNTDVSVNQYKGRKPNFLQLFDPKYHNLLIAIHKNHFDNICKILVTLPINKDLHRTIIQYFTQVEKIALHSSEIITKLYEEFILNKLDNNLLKYILGIIMICKADEGLVNKKKIYLTIDDDIRKYNKYLSDYNGISTYDILPKKRIYGVHQIIGLFSLSRYDVGSLRDILAYHSHYYGSFTPFWKNVLNDFDEHWDCDHDACKIKFSNMECEEYFNETFCLEHDEQSLHTQNQAIGSISPINIVDFCSMLNFEVKYHWVPPNGYTL